MNLPTSQSEGEIQRLLSVTLLRLDHFTLQAFPPGRGLALSKTRSLYCQPAVGQLSVSALLCSEEGGSGQ